MRQWHTIMWEVLAHGTHRPDRTGTGTLALFGMQLVFDNSTEFPAVTTKKLGFGQVLAELSCFLHGYQWLSQFNDAGCKIWDGNAMAPHWLKKHRTPDEDVWLGRIYGVQWRDWRSVKVKEDGFDLLQNDQLKDLIAGIRQDPYGRRHIVTAWNPGELQDMCLPPCHILFQAFVADGELSLRVDMRSVDLFLGLPFDIASYAVLQRLLAKETGLRSGRLVFQLGDAHIYMNHLDAVREVLERSPMQPPRIVFTERASLLDFLPGDACLVGYNSHAAVAAKLNV